MSNEENYSLQLSERVFELNFIFFSEKRRISKEKYNNFKN